MKDIGVGNGGGGGMIQPWKIGTETFLLVWLSPTSPTFHFRFASFVNEGPSLSRSDTYVGCMDCFINAAYHFDILIFNV